MAPRHVVCIDCTLGSRRPQFFNAPLRYRTGSINASTIELHGRILQTATDLRLDSVDLLLLIEPFLHRFESWKSAFQYFMINVLCCVHCTCTCTRYCYMYTVPRVPVRCTQYSNCTWKYDRILITLIITITKITKLRDRIQHTCTTGQLSVSHGVIRLHATASSRAECTV